MNRPNPTTPAGPVLVAAMAVAVLAGAPLVYLLWDAVNELLTGNVGEIAVVPTVVAASVFAVLLWVLGRSVMRVVGEPDTRIEARLTGASQPSHRDVHRAAPPPDAGADGPAASREPPTTPEAP